MADSIADFEKELAYAKTYLNQNLADGRASATELAVARKTVLLMEAQLKSQPNSVLRYNHLSEKGFSGAALWHIKTANLASEQFHPKDFKPALWQRKMEEYLDLALKLQAHQQWEQVLVDKKNGIQYILYENKQVKETVNEIASALLVWHSEHQDDPEFYQMSAQAGLYQLFKERNDLLATLRFSQTLPLDVEKAFIGIDRPLFVEVTEIAIGMIPIVGTAVSLYETYTGRDLFGYALDPLERCILGVSALLPTAGRFVKGARTLYTTRRMVSLYGRDARQWAMVLGASERLNSNIGMMRKLRQAEDLIHTKKPIEPQIAKDLGEGLKQLGLTKDTIKSFSSDIPKEIVEAYDRITKRFSILTTLDELSVQRVMNKVPNIDHMKGQLLEELLESQITKWLKDPAGLTALGLEGTTGKLEFIPGHLIRDSKGMQVTDGIIARKKRDVLEIVTIFEAKAGKSASRELGVKYESLASLSKEERAQVRAYAQDILRELIEQARLDGVQVKKTIEEIERELPQKIEGGQIRLDIERLVENADGTLTQVLIGGVATRVKVTPKLTKFIGVLPKDVKTGKMEREIQSNGFQFEVLGINIKQQELIDIAKDLSKSP